MTLKIATSLLLLLFLSSNAIAKEKLPEGAIKAGSLSNQKLIKDAMLGVAGKVAILGCDKPEGFKPYVLAMPQGKKGLEYWEELWVVKGCKTTYPVKIKFQLDATGASYRIKN